MDQLHPMLDRRWLGEGRALVQKSEDGRVKRQRFKPGHHGRGDAGDRLLVRRLLIASPTKFPAGAGQGIERIERMRRKQAGKTVAANAPTPVDQHLSLAAETGKKISGGLPGANNPGWRS